MKRLLITLLLISPFSFADWGDVYYCHMTGHITLDNEGERTDYILGKFQFKLDETKNSMVFGKEGYFEGAEMELTEGSGPSKEYWFAEGFFENAYFGEGKFLYSLVFVEIRSISADCEKF